MPPVVAFRERHETAPAARSREIYVSVQSRDDTPITGLTAADFTVREDGTAREVLEAEPATEPMQIMLLVDDSRSRQRDLRAPARAQGVRRRRCRAETRSRDDRRTPDVRRGADGHPRDAEQGTSRIFARPGVPAPTCSEALLDVSRGLQRRERSAPSSSRS